MATLTHDYELRRRRNGSQADLVTMVSLTLNDDGTVTEGVQLEGTINQTSGALSITAPDGYYRVSHNQCVQAVVPAPWNADVYVIVSGSADLLELTAYRTVEALRLAVERASADARYATPERVARVARAIAQAHYGEAHESLGPVMASPVTIEVGANGDHATLAPASQHSFQNPVVEADGHTVTFNDTNASALPNIQVRFLRGVAYVYTNVGRTYIRTIRGTLAPTYAQGPASVEFEFAGPFIAIQARTAFTNGYFRVRIDGEYVSLTPTTTASSWQGLIKIPMPDSTSMHHVEVETWGLDVGRFAIGPTNTLRLPPERQELNVLSLGTSFMYGSAATIPGFDGMMEVARQLTGLRNWANDGLGSSGLLRETGGGNNYLERLTAYPQAAAEADVIVFECGPNDNIYTFEQVKAQAAACFALVAPAPVVAYSVASSNPIASGYDTVSDAVEEALSEAPNGLAFLNLQNVLTGTGNAGSTTGLGNSDLIRSADGVHPTAFGHQVYGRLIAEWMRGTVIPLLGTYIASA